MDGDGGGGGGGVRLGAIVWDTVRRSAAVVCAVEGDLLRLARPGAGVREVRRADVRTATPAEALSVKVAMENRSWGK